MRRSPALSLLPVLLCALLCTGCQSTPEDAVPYSEDAIYAFLEDAVLSGEPSVTGYFTGNGTAPSSDALDALLHEAIDQSGILYYYVSEYRWANRPAGPSCIRLTVKFTYDSTADRTTEPLAAASPQDAVHTVAQALSDGTFCIALRPEGGRWSETDVEQLALSAIDNAALPCTVSTSYLLCPAERSDRQFVALLYEPMLEEAEYTSCKSELDEALSTLSAAIRAQTPDGNPQVLYRAVHDAVIETAEYDYALSDYIDTVNSAERMGPEYTAYGALVEGSTVCYGYASAFKLLCDRLDLPCWSVGGTSEGIGHQWNIVRLDGENYIVDCTWDDTTGTDNYFLCPVDSPDYQIDDTSLYGW
ncbi:hypothetical protein LI036_10005 [bacterium 210917-DFI.7.65]|nr:hypothetical protein [bacterium 210917-DFI.7.65]